MPEDKEGILDSLYENGVELAVRARVERARLDMVAAEEQIAAEIQTTGSIMRAVLDLIPNVLAYHISLTGLADETWANRCRFAPTLMRNIRNGRTPQHVTVRLPGLEPFFLGLLFDYDLKTGHFFVGQWTGELTQNKMPKYTTLIGSSTDALEMIGRAKIEHARWMAENAQQQ